MEYSPLEKIPYYSECEPLIRGLGCFLVELKVSHVLKQYQVKAVISCESGVGIVECAKVHRVLLARLEAVFQTQEIYMEVTSPGIERLLKNAAEFFLFIGRNVRVWDTIISDWIAGTIESADEKTVTLLKTNEQIKEKKEADADEIVCIPFEHIAKAKLCTH